MRNVNSDKNLLMMPVRMKLIAPWLDSLTITKLNDKAEVNDY